MSVIAKATASRSKSLKSVLGGIAIVGIIVMVALKVLGFLPERLDDEAMQQHAAFLATDHA